MVITSNDMVASKNPKASNSIWLHLAANDCSYYGRKTNLYFVLVNLKKNKKYKKIVNDGL